MAELERIAPSLASCRTDANATLHYCLFSDGLFWSDEFANKVEHELMFRYLLMYRTSLINATELVELRPFWERALELSPHWPGFQSARVTPSTELQEFYKAAVKDCERYFDEDFGKEE